MTHIAPGLIIESLLILLLVLTVSYCMILNRRLSRLRSSQQDLRAVIGELCAATQTAESAIQGLKATTEEADTRLSDKLCKAQLLARELSVLTDGVLSAHQAAVAAEVPSAQAVPAPPPMPQAAPVQPRPLVPTARTAEGAFAASDFSDWRQRTMSRLTSPR